MEFDDILKFVNELSMQIDLTRTLKEAEVFFSFCCFFFFFSKKKLTSFFSSDSYFQILPNFKSGGLESNRVILHNKKKKKQAVQTQYFCE